MIKHRLFNKNELVYTYMISTNDPFLMIPVKGRITDVRYDELNPRYRIKILKFYDHFTYLKKTLPHVRIQSRFNDKPRMLKFGDDIINKYEIKTVAALEAWIGKSSSNYIIIDSLFCFKKRHEMELYFDKFMNHFIEINMQNLKRLMVRSPYKGTYKIESPGNFKIRLERFIGDKVVKDGKSFDNYMRRL
jgi:hypothetical protein